MAISFVGSVSGSAIDGLDATLDLTTISGLAQNDLVIVSYVIGGDADYAMSVSTAGYTQVAELFSDDTRDTNLEVDYKFMGASPDASVVCAGVAPIDTRGAAAVAMAFRGVDTGTPMDVAATTATGLSTFHPNPPSIDWTTAGTWVVIAGGCVNAVGAAGSFTFPTGYTTNAIDKHVDENIDGTVGMGYNAAPADPEDPGTMTHSGTDTTSDCWCAVTMALRPAAAGSSFMPILVGV